jgi:hypothetical protein
MGATGSRACEAACVEPVTHVYEGNDPFGEAVHLNILRRHLTPGQRAGILVKSEALKLAQEAAHLRMVTGVRGNPTVHGPGGSVDRPRDRSRCSGHHIQHWKPYHPDTPSRFLDGTNDSQPKHS